MQADEADTSYDEKTEKSELLAKLEEMTKAIDVYKDFKAKQGCNTSTVA